MAASENCHIVLLNLELNKLDLATVVYKQHYQKTYKKEPQLKSSHK